MKREACREGGVITRDKYIGVKMNLICILVPLLLMLIKFSLEYQFYIKYN
jgi:hypothetical protein